MIGNTFNGVTSSVDDIRGHQGVDQMTSGARSNELNVDDIRGEQIKRTKRLYSKV